MTLHPRILSQLRESLSNLASPAAQQIEHLRRQGPIVVDELGLEFDDVSGAVMSSGWLTDEATAAVERVQQRLESMGGLDKSPLWTEAGLHEAPDWAEVRELAAAALRLLPLTPPSEGPPENRGGRQRT